MTTQPSLGDSFNGMSVGDEYFLSDWLELDAEHLKAFAFSTYLDDEHVDLTVSRNNPFGAELVDGFWMVSSLLYFHFKYGTRETERDYGFNYGLNRVRFTAPLLLGEPVRVRSTISAIDRRPDGVLLTTHNVMEGENKNKPYMVADLMLLRVTPDLNDKSRGGTHERG